MKLLKLSILSALALLVAGCSEPKPEAAAAIAPNEIEIRAALQSEIEKVGIALQSKDHAGFAALFTEDATWVLPDATTYIGRPAIEAGQKAFIETFDTITAGPQIIDKLVIINDSEAVVFASLTLTIMSQGKVDNLINPYAAYMQKGADGIWRVAYDVNALGPVKAPMPK